MKKILFRNIFPIIFIYVYYIFNVLIGFSISIPDNLQSYQWVLMTIIIPFVLGMLLCRIINKQTLSKKIIFQKSKSEDYIKKSILLLALMICFILYDNATQNCFLNKLSFSTEGFFKKFNEPYCYLNLFIPYSSDVLVCFLSAFVGYSFYRILFDTSTLSEND